MASFVVAVNGFIFESATDDAVSVRLISYAPRIVSHCAGFSAREDKRSDLCG